MIELLAPMILAQACYESPDGSIVDLGTMCDYWLDEPASPIATDEGFPAWLFDNEARKPYETGQVSELEYARWIYANRYILTFREWPYTATATNKAEWTYVDCQTLNVAGESLGLAGDTGDWSITPEEAFDPDQHRDIYGALCRSVGL
jgi:hypothetical protein